MRYLIIADQDRDKVIYDSYDNVDKLCITPSLHLELNNAGSLEFTLLPGHPLYDELKKLRSLVTVYCDDEEWFFGRVLISDKELDGRKTFTCEGGMTFFLDSEMEKGTYTETIEAFMQRCIGTHNAQVEEAKRFQLGEVTADKAVEIDTKTNATIQIEFKLENYNNTKNVLESLIVGKYGGFFRTRPNPNGYRFLDYIQTYGRTNTQTIKIAENVVDKTDHVSGENTFTILRPLGKNGLTLEGLSNKDLKGDFIQTCTETSTGYHDISSIIEDESHYKINVKVDANVTGANVSIKEYTSGGSIETHILADNADLKTGEDNYFCFAGKSGMSYVYIPNMGQTSVEVDLYKQKIVLNESIERYTLYSTAVFSEELFGLFVPSIHKNNKYRLVIESNENIIDTDIYTASEALDTAMVDKIAEEVSLNSSVEYSYTFTATDDASYVYISDVPENCVITAKLYSVLSIDGQNKLMIMPLIKDYGYVIHTENFSDIDDKQTLLKAAEDYIKRLGSQLPSTCDMTFVDFYIFNPEIMQVKLGDEFTSIEGFPGETMTVGEIQRDLENPANDNMVLRNKEEINANDPYSSSGSLSASYASQCTHVDYIYKYIKEEENKLSLMTEEIKIAASKNLQISSLLMTLTAGQLYLIADEVEVDDPDHPGQKIKKPGEIHLKARHLDAETGEIATELIVSLDNVQVSNGNLLVGGSIEAREILAALGEIGELELTSIYVNEYGWFESLEAESAIIAGYDFGLHTHGITCTKSGNEVTITIGEPGAADSDSFFLDELYRTASGIDTIVLSGQYNNYSQCEVSNITVYYDNDDETTMNRVVVNASAVYQAGQNNPGRDSRVTWNSTINASGITMYCTVFGETYSHFEQI